MQGVTILNNCEELAAAPKAIPKQSGYLAVLREFWGATQWPWNWSPGLIFGANLCPGRARSI